MREYDEQHIDRSVLRVRPRRVATVRRVTELAARRAVIAAVKVGIERRGLPTTGHSWLPFTQMGAFRASERTFVGASGTTLVDACRRRTFDAISSVWTCIHGHCHPRIVEAISSQARRLDHATTLGATNPAVEELAERLCAVAGMSRAFFASDGASAVEAALKMALQYWRNVGEPRRTRFVHLRASYHGDTVGCMSVSDIAAFRGNFQAVCFETLTYDEACTTLERDDVAALIVEPIVQAAAGMRIVPPAAYDALRLAGRPLLIVDEIATGFGRTGTLFAFSKLGLRPDLLCVGKGITGGTVALSATLTSEEVFEAFLSDSPSDLRHFLHGHSYAGNPIACAAALASLALFEEEKTLERVEASARYLERLLPGLRADERVAEVRQAGLMCGIVLREESLPPRPRSATKMWGVADEMYRRGQFTRPIGDVVQLVPPLVTTHDELDRFLAAFVESIR
jgi:adenosylmethionine-8-amino-7-oxononanoate aminotransferase